jgi:small-conductance mechanosensitive channel
VNDKEAKYFKRCDEYDLAWVRDALNVTRTELGQWKTLTMQFCDRLDTAEKSLHEARLQRQQDAIKIGSLSVERDEFKKICSEQEDRLQRLEASMDKAREYIKNMRKGEVVA